VSDGVLLLNAGEVERALRPAALVEALAAAMADLSSGAAGVAPRTSLALGDAGYLLAMTAHVPSSGIAAAKLVTLHPGNRALGLPSHLAVVAVFEAATGRLRALLDGERLTALRTAAGSALATRVLARADAGVLAVLGTGVQALAHARMLAAVRELRELRIAARDPAKARALAERLDGELELPVRAADTYAAAMAGAGVVCATTHSPEPVVRREWLDPGCHICSVGVHPEGREVDRQTVTDALVVVESRSAVLAEGYGGARELIEAVREARDGDPIHAELGEILLGRRPGRTSDDQLTLYKSVGVAVQDAAAAALAIEEAGRLGLGRTIELG
jgi:alanine dehydrogenase